MPGRDLSGVLGGSVSPDPVSAPIYFMNEDQVTRGSSQTNLITGAPFDAVPPPSCIESVVATLPTGDGSGTELWKLNHYYERLDEWNAEHGIAASRFAAPAAEPVFELHNLTADPEERRNLARDATGQLSRLRSVLDEQRETKRLVPSLRNP